MSTGNCPWVALCKHNGSADPEEIFISYDYDDVFKAAADWWGGYAWLSYVPDDPQPWRGGGEPVEVTMNESQKWVTCVSDSGGDGPTILFMQGTDLKRDTRTPGQAMADAFTNMGLLQDHPGIKAEFAERVESPVALLHDEVMFHFPVQGVASDAAIKAMAGLRKAAKTMTPSDWKEVGNKAAIEQGEPPPFPFNQQRELDFEDAVEKGVVNEAVHQAQLRRQADQWAEEFLEEQAAYQKYLKSISNVVGTDDLPTFEQWAERARGRRDPGLDLDEGED